MSLPTSRDETAVNGAPVSANLINSIQDQIIANNNNLTGAAAFNATINGTLSVSGVVRTAEPLQFGAAGAVPVSGAAIADVGNAPGLALNTTIGNNWLNIPGLPVGMKIIGWAVACQKNSASGTISAGLYEMGTSSPTQIGTTKTNNAASPGNIVLSETGLSAVVSAGKGYYIKFNGGGVTGDFVISWQITPGL